MIATPGPIAASDIPHYIAQLVRDLNAELAKYDGMAMEIDDLKARLAKVEAPPAAKK
jgi:hypothetical protein